MDDIILDNQRLYDVIDLKGAVKPTLFVWNFRMKEHQSTHLLLVKESLSE